jgi:hypothetical protein
LGLIGLRLLNHRWGFHFLTWLLGAYVEVFHGLSYDPPVLLVVAFV